MAQLASALGGGTLSRTGGPPAMAPHGREPALYPLSGRGTRPGGAGRSRRAAARSPVTGNFAGGPPGGVRLRNAGSGLAAAVLGERCSLALAASLASVQAPADALGEALAARLLAENHEEGVRQIRFPHPLVRAAIYADLSPARRAALHLSAARLTAGNVALSHRVAAAAGPDATLAAELAELAEAESAGGLYAPRPATSSAPLT